MLYGPAPDKMTTINMTAYKVSGRYVPADVTIAQHSRPVNCLLKSTVKNAKSGGGGRGEGGED
jgi:hypothetical protein